MTPIEVVFSLLRIGAEILFVYPVVGPRSGGKSWRGSAA